MIVSTERVIAQGGFGKVYVGKEDKTEREIAVKEIFIGGLKPDKVEKTLKEATLLSSLTHPCVIRYLGHEVREDHLFIFMEYAPYGTLEELIEEKNQTNCAFSQDEIVRLFAQVVHAVVYIHENGIIHRDIHVKNVLRGRGYRLKLCDFGISRRLKSESTEGALKGHTSCFSPELLRGGKHSKETDMWSVGCLLYYLTVLKPPFQSPTLAGQVAAVLSPEMLFVTFPNNNTAVSSSYSPLLTDLVRSLLTLNPKRRPTAKSLTTHPLLVKAVHTAHLNVPTMAAPEGFDELKNKYAEK